MDERIEIPGQPVEVGGTIEVNGMRVPFQGGGRIASQFITVHHPDAAPAPPDGEPPAPEPEPPAPPSPDPPIENPIVVSLNGSDSNPGTQDRPFRSPQRAIDMATPGRHVLFRGGTWNEKFDVRGNGEDGAPIVIQPYPGERVTVTGDGLSSNLIRFVQKTGYKDPIRYVKFRGFELAYAGKGNNAGLGIQGFNLFNCDLEDLNIHHSAESGILIVSSNGLAMRRIRSNENGQSQGAHQFDHGIYATGQNMLIENCLLAGNYHRNLQLAGYPFNSGNMTDPSFATIDGCKVINCTLAENIWRTAIAIWEAGGAIRNVTFANTLVYRPTLKTSGWSESAKSGTFLYYANDGKVNDAETHRFLNLVLYDHLNRAYWTGGDDSAATKLGIIRDIDPRLDGDYRPGAGSVCVGAADPAFTPPVDIDGRPRTKDTIGCFEAAA